MTRSQAIFIVSAAGGTGKTTTAQLIEAAASLQPLEVRIVDADPANAGLSIETADVRITKLRDLASPTAGMGIRNLARAVAASATMLIVDTGAAINAMDVEVNNAFRDLAEELAACGVAPTFILPVATSKGQSERVISGLAERFSRHGSVVPAVTDAMGSGQLPPWAGDLGLPICHVPRIANGFQALRKRLVEPLSVFLRREDFELVACQAAWADAVLELLGQRALGHVAAGWDLQQLDRIRQRGRASLSMTPGTAAEARTTPLGHLGDYHKALDVLLRDAAQDPSHPARPLHDALQAYGAAAREPLPW